MNLLDAIGGTYRGDAAGKIASSINNRDAGDELFENVNQATGGNPYEMSEIQKLANELGMKLNASTKDYLVQYYLNEKARKNAFADSMMASNTQYQRAVADLRKAGLNPFLALQGLNGSSPSSDSANVSGGFFSENLKTARDREKTVLTVLTLVALGVFKAIF